MPCKDDLKRKVVHLHEKEKQNKLELKGGLYTPAAMKTKLQLSEMLV